eukprot:6534899-Prymnesium_polylepis.1
MGRQWQRWVRIVQGQPWQQRERGAGAAVEGTAWGRPWRQLGRGTRAAMAAVGVQCAREAEAAVGVRSASVGARSASVGARSASGNSGAVASGN